MRLLEDEHGSETDGVDTAGADVDVELLHRLDEGGRVDGVEGDVCTAKIVSKKNTESMVA